MIGALTLGSKTFGDPACLGMFRRWHCKHDQDLRDTRVEIRCKCHDMSFVTAAASFNILRTVDLFVFATWHPDAVRVGCGTPVHCVNLGIFGVYRCKVMTS